MINVPLSIQYQKSTATFVTNKQIQHFFLANNYELFVYIPALTRTLWNSLVKDFQLIK